MLLTFLNDIKESICYNVSSLIKYFYCHDIYDDPVNDTIDEAFDIILNDLPKNIINKEPQNVENEDQFIDLSGFNYS
jgi:hypothetical protein